MGKLKRSRDEQWAFEMLLSRLFIFGSLKLRTGQAVRMTLGWSLQA